MTEQEIFNKVYTHLLTQGRKARTPNGHSCAYRGQGVYKGTSCAVGCLIPDEMYSARIESATVFQALGGSIGSAAIVLRRVLTDLGLDRHRELLQALQRIHDDYEPGNWAECLSNLAKVRNLTIPELP